MTTIEGPAADAWSAFADAVALRDEERARSLAAPGSWRKHGESAAKLFHVGADFTFGAPAAQWVADGRAVLEVPIHRDGRQAPLFVLLVDGRVAAGVRSEVEAALFLAGDVPAVAEVTDLPASPLAEGWARRLAAELAADRVLSVADLEAASGLPVLAAVPRWAEDGVAGFRALPDDDPAVLATGDLLAALADAGPKLVFASSSPGEGAAAVVAGLAHLYAAAGDDVLVVDLDLARPTLHAAFGILDRAPGLSDALAGDVPWASIVREAHGVTVVPAGTNRRLGQAAFAMLAEKLSGAHDRVLVLAPAAGLAPVAGLGLRPVLVAHAGGVTAAAVGKLAKRAPDPVGLVATRVLAESVPGDLSEPAVDALRPWIEGTPTQLEVLGTHALRDRALVGLRRHSDGAPVTEWLVLSPPDTDVLARGSDPTFALLASGWDLALPDRPAPEDRVLGTIAATLQGLAQAVSAIPEEARSVEGMAEVVAKALEDGGRADEAAQLRRDVAERAGQAPADPPPASDAKPAPPLVDALREDLASFAAEHGGDGEVTVDEDLLQEHGAELASRFLRTVAGALSDIPPVDVPVTLSDGETDKPVKLKLDLGGMFGRLLARAPKASE